MAAPETTAGEESKATILAILAENRIMSLATLRADGVELAEEEFEVAEEE